MPQKRHIPKCPHCGEYAKYFRIRKSDPQRLWCPACSKTYEHIAAPKVLILDIETSQIELKAKAWASNFKYRDVRLSTDDIEKDWFVICWSGKWLFQKDTFGSVVTPKEAKSRNDKRVMKELHEKMKTADYIVTHNGNKFDIKKINWRFIYHKIPPIQRYTSIDTFAELKKVAEPTSYALDFLAKQLGYGGKLETDVNLWDKCEAGDQESLSYMLKYNMVDIWKTEDLYAHIKPYLKTHPNFAAFMDMYEDVGKGSHRCPRCINGIISDEKFRESYQTPTGYFYQVASCPNCGCMVRKMTRRGNKQDVKVR